MSLCPAQVEYTADGIPSAREEEVRWLTNRARFDRDGENDTRHTAYSDIPVTSGPLAPAHSLTMSARHQSEDLAKSNKVQSDTVSGSAYYDPVTQASPFDRMLAEGYGSYSAWGENIGAGMSSAEEAFVTWWGGAADRQNLANPGLLEVGTGYFFWDQANHRHYWTMDLMGGEGSFFTDTAFFDADGNGKYTQGEGVSGIRISLRIKGVEHAIHDIPAAGGSFAVPLDGISGAQPVEVWLINQNSSAATLSIPRDYRFLELMTFNPGVSTLIGSFVRPESRVNFGFRNLERTIPPVPAPALALTKTGQTGEIAWPSQSGLLYLAQWSPDLTAWTDFPGGYREGTGGTMKQTDATMEPQRYYRVVVKKP